MYWKKLIILKQFNARKACDHKSFKNHKYNIPLYRNITHTYNIANMVFLFVFTPLKQCKIYIKLYTEQWRGKVEKVKK